MTTDPRPLIAHIVHRLDYGGMENGVINLVNRLPQDQFRHAIIALTEVSDFRTRITRPDVTVHALGKRPGKDPGAYLRLFRLLRSLRPALAHTRNIGTIDCAVVASAAGVRWRVHGEHGWDVHDPDGTHPKYRAMRRLAAPLIQRFVALSEDLERYLLERVRISRHKVVRICNGVDVERFRQPAAADDGEALPSPFPPNCVVVGSITRFSEIKDPLNLVRAFISLRGRFAAEGLDVRLMMAGDGALRTQAEEALSSAGMAHAAWLPGSRDDVHRLMKHMDVFALGSKGEGISNTVLEAMASGLPVVATAVGGNLELIRPGVTGALVPAQDPERLAAAIGDYVVSRELRIRHGAAARERAVREYSLSRMVRDYASLYQDLCGSARVHMGAVA